MENLFVVFIITFHWHRSTLRSHLFLMRNIKLPLNLFAVIVPNISIGIIIISNTPIK